MGANVKSAVKIMLGIILLGSCPQISWASEPFTWTGWYVGAEGGGANARTKQTNLNTGVSLGFFNQTGGFGGGTLGYNWQFAPWIFGLETDLAWGRIRGAETDCGPARNQICPTEEKAFGTARARAGVAVWDRTMLYVAGGLAYADIHAFKEQTAVTGGENWRAGWTIGTGLETMFAPHWSFKIEYLYATFPGTAAIYTIVASGTRVGALERDMQIGRIGLNWHF
jgi:outer membrane immunogenic protein